MPKYSGEEPHSKEGKRKYPKGRKGERGGYERQATVKDAGAIQESVWILEDSGAVTGYRSSGQLRKADKYFMGVTVSKGAERKPLNELTGFEKIEMIRQGLSKEDLLTIKGKSGLDYGQLSAVLSAARATLINKKGNARFNRDLSEKIFSLADIYAYGYQVFEDVTRFNEWVFAPNNALGGQKPFDLLDSQYGREEIKNLIGRIEYGIYS